MNADRLEGLYLQAKGWVQQAVGRLTGNRALLLRGKAKAFSGAAQASFGRSMGAARLLGVRRRWGV